MVTILFEQDALPEQGNVELSLNRSFEIKVSAAEARRKVHIWLLDDVSCMMGAEAPLLTIGKRIVWRVPVHFSAPPMGIVGTVGMVDVDLQTGEILFPALCKAAIQRSAQELAARLPAYQPLNTIPESSIPKHLPPAPILQLPADYPAALAAD